MAIYRLRATNEHGQADCEAKLVYDSEYICIKLYIILIAPVD